MPLLHIKFLNKVAKNAPYKEFGNSPTYVAFNKKIITNSNNIYVLSPPRERTIDGILNLLSGSDDYPL